MLTSVTMSIVPSPSVMNMDFYVMTDSTNPQAFDMVAYVMSKLPDLVDAGVSGYPGVVNTVAEALIIPAAANSTRFVKGMMGKLIMLNTTNPANITRLFDPIFAHINATWPGFTATTNTTFFPSFNEWYRVNYDPTLTGFENIVGSRLLNRDALTTDPMSVKVAIAKFSAWGQAEVFMVSGKGVHDAKPRGGGNAVLPAWRNAYVHASQFLLLFPPFSPFPSQAPLRRRADNICSHFDQVPSPGRRLQGVRHRGVTVLGLGSARHRALHGRLHERGVALRARLAAHLLG